MKEHTDFQDELDALQDGATKQLLPREFAGPIVLRRHLTLDGQGAIIWARHGPVVSIQGDEIHLRNLRIEITGEGGAAQPEEACAIRLQPGRNLYLENVEVRGSVIGLPEEEGEWQYPHSLNPGQLTAGQEYDVILHIVVPVPCHITSHVPCLEVEPHDMTPGPNDIRLHIKCPSQATPLNGYLSLATKWLKRRIHVSAQVLSSDAVLVTPEAGGKDQVIWEPQDYSAHAADQTRPLPGHTPVRDAAVQRQLPLVEADMPITEVIGFDLGHGEFALARASLQAGTDVLPLQVNKRYSQITAVGRMPKQQGESKPEILVGERAFLRFKDLDHFTLGFKGKPRRDADYQRNMKDFVQAIYDALVKDKEILGANSSHFIVGCPSKWSETERGNYEQLLKETGIPYLTVVAESSAVMLNANESGQIEREGTTALVIDIGSSTTDFTFFSGLSYEEPIFEYGDELGAGLIEEAIYQHTLQTHPQRQLLEELLKSERKFHYLWNFICRRIKEEYFTHKEDYTESGAYIDIGRLGADRHRDFTFEPLIDGPTMLEIFEKPLVENHLSWPEAFQNLLQLVRAKINENQRHSVDLIVLAGGGSRMHFIEDIVKKVFPSSTIKSDLQKELSVAKGLAYWGRWDYLSQNFKDEVQDFCQTKLIEIFRDAKDKLIESSVPALVDGLIKDIVEPKMYEWRNGKIDTINDLEKSIKSSGKKYIEKGDGNKIIVRQLQEWLRPIKTEIERHTDIFCHKYGIPPGTLNTHIDISMTGSGISYSSIELPEVIRTVLGIAQVIGTLVIASVLGGAGLAIMISGPVGWVIGLGVGVAIVTFGREYAEEKIKDFSFPLFIKKRMITENTITAQCWDKQRVKKLSTLAKEALGRDDAFGKTIQKIAAKIQGDLGVLADKAKWKMQ